MLEVLKQLIEYDIFNSEMRQKSIDGKQLLKL